MSAKRTIRTLVVDDDTTIRTVLADLLTSLGHEVDATDSAKAAEEALATKDYDIAILDIRMPDGDGLQVLDNTRKRGIPTEIIVITAEDTMNHAIEAMRAGAFDYISKPFNIEELEIVIAKAIETVSLRRTVNMARKQARKGVEPGRDIIGQSGAMRDLFKTIGRMSDSNETLLITGESGTGKELIAHAVHAHSGRFAGPFIAVNTAAIPEQLLESELFGHEKGSFTGASRKRDGSFALASGGTIFLDEIGEMPLMLQAKLLRTLQEREYTPVGGVPQKADVRVIAATNRDLGRMVAAGKFREDLYYRLAVLVVKVPPLRDRPEDIRPLADYFLSKHGSGRTAEALAAESARLLESYPWPGNVRQLENAIKRAVTLSSRAVLGPEDFPELGQGRPFFGGVEQYESLEDLVRAKLAGSLADFAGDDEQTLYEAVNRCVERPLIEIVLARTGGNQLKAAEMLGINRNTLRVKMRRLSVTTKRG